MPNEQFEIGDVVDWNHEAADLDNQSLLERVVKYGYSRGPFVIVNITNNQCAVVKSLDGSKLLESGIPKRTDYLILYENLQKNIFLTAARKAVENAR